MKSDRFLVPELNRIPLPQYYKYKTDKPPLERKVFCQCHQLIAIEWGYPNKTAIEHLSITRFGVWKKGKWWGNKLICPTCGANHTLPMDKSLVYDDTGLLPAQKLGKKPRLSVLKI